MISTFFRYKKLLQHLPEDLPAVDYFVHHIYIFGCWIDMIFVFDWVSAKQKDSLAIQLPTEKMVYMAFIHTRRVLVLDVVSPARQCG